MAERVDVVIVGAGLAGLACATTLQRRGVDARLLEASDVVGGRVATDVVDGHLCDVGFQLLNPAYPALRDLVDLDALDLQPFAAGVRVRRGGSVATLGDPRREPRLLAPTLRSGLLRPRELAALARWAAPILGGEGHVLRRADDTVAASLDAAGVRGPLRRQVLEPFLAGVLADDTGATSARYARLLVRWFLLGTPAVPGDGMRALPARLAGGLRRPAETGVRVLGVDRGAEGVTVRTGSGSLRARAVVVATDVQDAVGLGAVGVVDAGLTRHGGAPAQFAVRVELEAHIGDDLLDLRAVRRLPVRLDLARDGGRDRGLGACPDLRGGRAGFGAGGAVACSGEEIVADARSASGPGSGLRRAFGSAGRRLGTARRGRRRCGRARTFRPAGRGALCRTRCRAFHWTGYG
ncbi:FAD-dependent oxidoreductase, partial [Aeromicrobium sp. REDSEA-S38_B2]|uniref:FAD-dependent oxidoreductase n=1 Tax=Aeromicrobium sp. REDSEA-S38_B2 TaxID=1811528 RepID=UPI000B166EB7